MSVTNQEEYETPSGDVVSIQYDADKGIWEVACWDANDECRWYKEFRSPSDARTEFERFK